MASSLRKECRRGAYSLTWRQLEIPVRIRNTENNVTVVTLRVGIQSREKDRDENPEQHWPKASVRIVQIGKQMTQMHSWNENGNRLTAWKCNLFQNFILYRECNQRNRNRSKLNPQTVIEHAQLMVVMDSSTARAYCQQYASIPLSHSFTNLFSTGTGISNRGNTIVENNINEQETRRGRILFYSQIERVLPQWNRTWPLIVKVSCIMLYLRSQS